MPDRPLPEVASLALLLAQSFAQLFAQLAALPLAAQDPPTVVSLAPANGAVDVDAATTTQLVIEFDRAMNQGGWSLCGGGPSMPNVTERPQWRDARTLVLTVRLEPDHDYSLGINCPAATNFRSAAGVALLPVPWSFTTLPKELPDPKVQKQRNRAATEALLDTLAARYSHYDLRVGSWKKLLGAHEKALLSAPTDAAWANAAAQMLAPTADIHLALRLGDRWFATGRRAVDPLFRAQHIGAHFSCTEPCDRTTIGRSADGIGYLRVDAWSGVDPDRIGQAITELLDTRAMVIDCRTNSGGDETLAQRVAAWFVDGEVVYARNRYRTGKGKKGFGPVLERKLTGNPDGKRYDRPIAVLTSRYAMSSNESFVMMLQQAKDRTLVGQPTFGSSGNPRPFPLDNGVTVVVPTWQDLRLDGTCIEGEGIAPDVLVECTGDDLAGGDPILERALALLRKKLGDKK
ncbi:MAG: S41 family peptidase [Planctomycetota bacterium]